MAGEWRSLHNEQLCNLYASLNIIRFGWAGYNTNGNMRNACKMLVQKSEGVDRMIIFQWFLEK
jgi:hypothetical protein